MAVCAVICEPASAARSLLLGNFGKNCQRRTAPTPFLTANPSFMTNTVYFRAGKFCEPVRERLGSCRRLAPMPLGWCVSVRARVDNEFDDIRGMKDGRPELFLHLLPVSGGYSARIDSVLRTDNIQSLVVAL